MTATRIMADLCHMTRICCGAGFIFFLVLIINSISSVSSIGCFVCSSINGSEPDCEDTFNNTGRFYQAECFSGRKNRNGLFPGTECIKMKAELVAQPFSVLIRSCVVDNGDVNSETEIGRLDHCGFINWIKYNERDYRGCIVACDTDGCNAGSRINTLSTVTMTLFFSTLSLVCVATNFV